MSPVPLPTPLFLTHEHLQLFERSTIERRAPHILSQKDTYSCWSMGMKLAFWLEDAVANCNCKVCSSFLSLTLSAGTSETLKCYVPDETQITPILWLEFQT